MAEIKARALSTPPAEPEPIEGAIRRPVGNCAPEILALYELLVAARQGVRRFERLARASDEQMWWVAAFGVDELIDGAQRLVEQL